MAKRNLRMLLLAGLQEFVLKRDQWRRPDAVRGSLAHPNRRTVCGVVVTYRPDAGFPCRVRRLSHQVGRIVIVDNGSPEPCVAQAKALAEKLSAHLILNKENKGVATALNQGAEWAAEQGFDWILTLDQDTVVGPDMVESLCSVYRSFCDRARLAVIASNYVGTNSGRMLVPFDGKTGRLWRKAKAVITSGSLFSLAAFRELCGFRDEFFIDGVDVEYCLRARSRGFEVVLARKPLMQHCVGNITMHRLLGVKTWTSNHSPVRRYYMARNQMILAREYLLREPFLILAGFLSLVKSIIWICLLEDDVMKKVKYVSLGVFDGTISNFQRGIRP